MKPKSVEVVCPLFSSVAPLNTAELKKMISTLNHTDSKVFQLPDGVSAKKALGMVKTVTQYHDVAHVRDLRRKTDEQWARETWFYGRTSVKDEPIVVMGAADEGSEQVQVSVYCNLSEMAVGLLAEIGRELMGQFEKLGPRITHISIRDSVIYRSKLLG